MKGRNEPTKTDATKDTTRTGNQPPPFREDFFRDPKDEPGSQWEGFKDTLKKIAAVPKEEVDEMRAEHEREKKEKRAE